MAKQNLTKKLKVPDYTRKRIIGTEQEYGIWLHDSNGRQFSDNGDGFISNGGYIYNDCGHPEYASPEASNPLDAVRYSKAGEALIKDFVKKSNDYYFFKHVADGRKHSENNSFGAHESYSMKEINSWNPFVEKTLGFFTTRIIYAGSGGINEEGVYEISQKARSINETSSEDTTDNKPIINTKDEAHSNKYMRFHHISGDANMSQVAEYLKLGTTALVLDLYEDGKLERMPVLEDALESFHSISLDSKLKKRFETSEGKMTAIRIQRCYQEAAESMYKGRDAMTDDILGRWKFVLSNLKKDPMKLDRQIDWVIKKRLIDSYMAKTGKNLDDVAVRNIDLMYHNIDKEKGLFYILQNHKLVDRLLTDKQIELAVNHAPKDTRAWIRGKAVKKLGKDCADEWDCIDTEEDSLSIDDPFDNYSELVKELKK